MPESRETGALLDPANELKIKKDRLLEMSRGGLLNEFANAASIQEGDRLRREIAELEKLAK